MEFELLMYDIFEESRINLEQSDDDSTIYINIGRGFDDIAAESILGDAFYMPIGFTIVFVYVMVMLGGFSCVETRVRIGLSMTRRNRFYDFVNLGFSCDCWMHLNRSHNLGLLRPLLGLPAALWTNAQCHSIPPFGNWNR